MTNKIIKVLIVGLAFFSLHVKTFAASEVNIFDSLEPVQNRMMAPPRLNETYVLSGEDTDAAQNTEPAAVQKNTQKHSVFSKFKQPLADLIQLRSNTGLAEHMLEAEVEHDDEPAVEKPKKFWQKHKEQVVVGDVVPADVSNINIDSDTLEYFAERMEFEALGNAKIIFTQSNSVLEADKIIYNHDTNVIKAYDNVKLVREGAVVDGDYVQVNLNDEDNALITNPVTNMERIEIRALQGFIYSDRIETAPGTAKVKEDMIIPLRTSTFGAFMFPRFDFIHNNYKLDEKFADKYKIKTNKIVITRKDDHDIVTMTPAHVYFKGHRVLRGGDLTLVTNKAQEFVEIDGLELGSFAQIGMFLGYGKIFPMPGGSTLKVSPVLNLYDGKFGVGLTSRYKSRNNMTDFAYTTAANRMLLLGKHDFTPELSMRYGANTYIDDWILGSRLYEYMAQLDYDKEHFLEDIDVSFRHRLSAGIMGDYHRRFSTPRFRWQTQTAKSLMHYHSADKQYMFDFALVGQTSASVYGTGDTQLIGRFGPSVRTQVKNWTQTLSYFVGGFHDGTPLYADRYPYGKHSINLQQTLKLGKYLAIGYSGTLVPMKDNAMNDFIAENNFMVMLGPDEARMLLAYDTIRQRTQFSLQFLVGTKNTDVEYQKMIIKDPNKSGKKDNKKQQPQPSGVNL